MKFKDSHLKGDPGAEKKEDRLTKNKKGKVILVKLIANSIF